MLAADFRVFITVDSDEIEASKLTQNVTNLGILLNSEKSQEYI